MRIFVILLLFVFSIYSPAKQSFCADKFGGIDSIQDVKIKQEFISTIDNRKKENDYEKNNKIDSKIDNKNENDNKIDDKFEEKIEEKVEQNNDLNIDKKDAKQENINAVNANESKILDNDDDRTKIEAQKGDKENKENEQQNTQNTKNYNKNTDNIEKNKVEEEQKDEEEKIKEKEVFPYEEDYYKVFNSFTFTQSNLNLLKKTLVIYNKNKMATESKRQTIIEINEETGEEEEVEYDKNVGNVYLKSIMYISDDYWTVWINDKKISNIDNDDPDNEFVIKKISRNNVEIIWTVTRSKWNIINYENNIHASDYKFNDETNKIEFEIFLHPNQTFVASTNEIIDGKYREIKEEIINTITDENLDFMFGDEDIDLNLLISN